MCLEYSIMMTSFQINFLELDMYLDISKVNPVDNETSLSFTGNCLLHNWPDDQVSKRNLILLVPFKSNDLIASEIMWNSKTSSESQFLSG